MDEIASKWSTFSDVQKSGIATSLAGTRQRENLITLFENWDLVAKYEQISENAYGTAAKKMESYSDSVEAAKTRISAAVEKFVLALNASDSLKKFYNGVADLAENFGALSSAAVLILAWINRGSIVDTLAAGVGKLVGTMGRMAAYLENQRIANSVAGSGSGTYIGNAFGAAMDSAQETYMASMKQSYQLGMSNFIDSMSGVSLAWKTMTKAYMLPLQQVIMNLTQAEQSQIAAFLTESNLTQQELKTRAAAIVTKENSVLIQALVNSTTEEERAILLQGVSQKALDNEAVKNLIIARKKLISMYGKEESLLLGEQIKGFNSINPKSAIYTGAGKMVGSMVGATVGTKALGSLAEKVGLPSSLGQTVGMGLGAAVGSKAGSSIIGGLLGTGITATGYGAIAALVAGVFYNMWKSWKDKAKEEAQKEATEAINDYQDKLSASTNAAKFDELAKRVDQFGRNVSLTDEEYQDFLDISNELAEKFPDLIVRTDEYGNSFVGVEGKVRSVTDALEEQVKAAQRAADAKILSPETFKDSFKEARNQYSEAKDQREFYEKALKEYNQAQDNLKWLSNPKRYTDEIKANNLNIDLNDQNSINAAIVLWRQQLEAWQGFVEDDNAQEIVSQSIQKMSSAQALLSDEQKAAVRLNDEAQRVIDSLSEDGQVVANQTINKAISNLDLSQYGENNYDQYQTDVSQIAEKIAKFYKDNPVLIDLQAKMEDSNSADEYNEARNKIMTALIKSFGEVSTWDDRTKQFVFALGFRIDDNNIISDDNILDKYKEQGYMNKLPKNINLGKYSIADLKTGYTLLGNGREFDSESSFQQAIMYDQIKGKGLQDIANMYKQYINTDEDLTPSQTIKKQILEGQLDEWAKEVGVVKSNYKDVSKYYDDIIKKAKIYGNLDKGGTSSETLSEAKTRMDKYAKYYKFMRDEYSKTGKWDIETYNEMLEDKELQPYLATNDTKGLSNYLQKAIKDAPNVYKNIYQQTLWGNTDINEQMQKDHKDVYDKFEEDYNIDLTKFTTLNAAKEWIDIYTNSVLSSDWDSWVVKMEQYYSDDLANFTDSTSKKLAMNKLILSQQLGMSKLQSSQWTQSWTQVYEDMGGSDYYGVDLGTFLNQQAFKEVQQEASDSAKGVMADWSKRINEGLQEIFNLIPGKNFKLDTLDDGTSNLKDMEDYLSALEGIYQKEYYLRKSYKDFGNINAGSEAAYMNSTYYAGLKQVYQLESQYYASKLPKGKKVTEYSKDQLGYLQKYQEAQIKLNNLDDEEWEDRINILELQGASLEKLIEANKEYEKTSDSLQEHIERQNKLNELLHQQIELEREVSEWQRDNTDRFIERLKGNAYDNPAYDVAMNSQIDAISNEIELTQKNLNKYYNEAVQGYMESGSSYQEALNLAYTGNSDASSSLRDEMTKYYDLIDNRAELTIQKMEDKADDLNRRLDLIEKEKPDEWFKIGDIDSYYTQRMDLLQKQVELYQDALKDTSDMTDEQIQNIVDSLNEATISLKEAQIDNLKDQTDLQSKQYDAIVYRINLWKDEIQDAIDAIEDAYDKEVKPLQEANDERQRALELEDKLAAKKAAEQERERVFREGIGWVDICTPTMDYIG